jgi:predicted signal transduction protein with EAL and GGDEF domain
MVEQTRDQDTVARVGGDEFVIVLNDLSDRRRLMRIAARLIEQLEVPIPFEGHTCHISGSIGITLTRDYDAPDAATMMNDADAALYAAKRAGRGCARLFEDGMTTVPDETAAEAPAAPVARAKPPHQVVRPSGQDVQASAGTGNA